MQVAPALQRRISRRCASRPWKNRTGFTAAGMSQDTAMNSELDCCGASSK